MLKFYFFTLTAWTDREETHAAFVYILYSSTMYCLMVRFTMLYIEMYLVMSAIVCSYYLYKYVVRYAPS